MAIYAWSGHSAHLGAGRLLSHERHQANLHFSPSCCSAFLSVTVKGWLVKHTKALAGRAIFSAKRGHPGMGAEQFHGHADLNFMRGGFLNYFGLQRFGTRQVRTHRVARPHPTNLGARKLRHRAPTSTACQSQVGAAIIAGDWQKAPRDRALPTACGKVRKPLWFSTTQMAAKLSSKSWTTGRVELRKMTGRSTHTWRDRW